MGHSRSTSRTEARPRSRNDPGGEAFGCPEPELIELVAAVVLLLVIIFLVIIFLLVIIVELSAHDRVITLYATGNSSLAAPVQAEADIEAASSDTLQASLDALG